MDIICTSKATKIYMNYFQSTAYCAVNKLFFVYLKINKNICCCKFSYYIIPILYM